jgi:hypothetical protein
MKNEGAGIDNGPAGGRGAAMSFHELCKRLHKPAGYVRALQHKLGLHIAVRGQGYTPAYLTFMKTVVAMRTFSVSIEDIKGLFEMEKSLLALLKVDSLSSSKTWYLDACDIPCDSENRLLLTNYDIGQSVTPHGVQFHLDFRGGNRELFTDHEMGADARRVLELYRGLSARLIEHVKLGETLLEESLSWSDDLLRGRRSRAAGVTES